MAYSSFRYMSQITPLSYESFFTPLWRTIKSSGRGGRVQEYRLQKITTKSKRNKNLKMVRFCAVFNCSNRADKKRGKSNYHFPSIIKNTGKERFKPSKVRREEKWLAQIFRKDLNETKIERAGTRIKIMLSAPPP